MSVEIRQNAVETVMSGVGSQEKTCTNTGCRVIERNNEMDTMRANDLLVGCLHKKG